MGVACQAPRDFGRDRADALDLRHLRARARSRSRARRRIRGRVRVRGRGNSRVRVRSRSRSRAAQEQLERCVHDDPGPHGWTASRQRCTPYAEQPHHRVVEALVIGHVTEGIQFVGIGLIRGIGRRRHHPPLVCSDSRHERRLRGGVVVRREGDPHGPPRVVEAQRTALELPDGRASKRVPLRPRALAAALRIARHLGPISPLLFGCRLSLRPVPRHQLPCLAHAPVRRRLTQCSIGIRRRHLRQGLDQVQRQLSRRQTLGQAGQGLEIGRRANPLPSRRRADPALSRHPRHHRDGPVPAPRLRSVELGDVGQLLPMQRRDLCRSLDDPRCDLL